jgi:hypothetical protein
MGADDAARGPGPSGDSIDSGEAGPGGRVTPKRVAIAVVAAVVVLAVVVGVVIASQGGDAAGYDEETRSNFIADCTADGGDPVRPACECWYSAIVQNIPYDRFEEVSTKLEAAQKKNPDAAPDVPDDFLTLLGPCKVEVPTSSVTTTTAANGISPSDDATTTSAADASTAPPTTAPAQTSTTASGAGFGD